MYAVSKYPELSCSKVHYRPLRLFLHFPPISHRIQYRITAIVSCCDPSLRPFASLRNLLPLRPLLSSVWFGSTSGAAFCCEGCAFGPLGTFSYYTAKGFFDCGSISME